MLRASKRAICAGRRGLGRGRCSVQSAMRSVQRLRWWSTSGGGWFRGRGAGSSRLSPSRWLRAAWCLLLLLLLKGEGENAAPFAELSGPGAKRQTKLVVALVRSGTISHPTLTQNCNPSQHVVGTFALAFPRTRSCLSYLHCQACHYPE